MKQRGEAILGVLAICAILGTVWTLRQPAIGRYALAVEGTSIVRMDTATGKMERCFLAGTRLMCEQIVANEK